MPLYQPKVPVRVAIGCSGPALVFQIVAVAGTGWLMWEASGHTKEDGLFRSCFDGTCLSITDNVGWLKACQAFSILALLTIAASLVLGVLHIFKEDPQKLILPARLCCIAAAVCVAVEVGVFLGKTVELVTASLSTLSYGYGFSKLSYGYGFYLSIVAGVLSVVSAVLHRSSGN